MSRADDLRWLYDMTPNGVPRVAFHLALFALFSEFTLSANVLEAIGVPYAEEGGSLLAKLHPGTYLAAASMSAHLVAGSHPLRKLSRLMCQERSLAIYFGLTGFCTIYAIIMTGLSGAVTLLDTFLPAGMIGAALCTMTRSQAAQLATMLRLLFLLNGTLGLAEAVIGSHLVPSFIALGSGPSDFRPTALYDHPLTGAAATMIGLLPAPDKLHTPWRRRGYQIWMIAALLAFGGRVALLAAVLGAMGLSAWRVGKDALAWRPTQIRVPSSFFFLILVVPLSAAVFAFGLANRLAAHMYWDPSAQVRISQFHMLGLMNMEQVLFGCRRSDLIALVEPLRLTYGVAVIENFWILMFATLGALCFPIFVLAMLVLMQWLWRRSGAEGRIMVISLVLVASTSNSLGRKSTLLTMLVGSVLAQTYSNFKIGMRQSSPPTWCPRHARVRHE